MHLLSVIIPAVREVRAPLVGGYLWLLAAWIAWGEHVPPKEELTEGSVFDGLSRLGDLIGAVGLVAALSVAAYLVGSLVAEILTRVTDDESRFGDLRVLASTEGAHQYAAERSLQLGSEADLRLHVAVGLITVASALVATGEPRIALVAFGLAGALTFHGWSLRRRSMMAGEVAIDALRRLEASTSDSELRARQAHIRVRADGERLTFRNEGPGTAQNIRLESVDNEPLGLVPRGLLPIEELRSGDETVVPLALSMADPSQIDALIKWVDASGPRTETVHLRFS